MGCVSLCHLCNVFKTSLGGKGFTPLVGEAMQAAAVIDLSPHPQAHVGIVGKCLGRMARRHPTTAPRGCGMTVLPLASEKWERPKHHVRTC